MNPIQIYILGVVIGSASTILLILGSKYLILQYEIFLFKKQLNRYVNKLHDNRPEKRKVLLQRRNRK